MNMDLVQISKVEGRVPVTVFQLKDRVNLGNFAELEQTAKDAYEAGMRDLVIDLSQTPLAHQHRHPRAGGHSQNAGQR